MRKRTLAGIACGLVIATTAIFTGCTASFDASLPSYNMNVYDLSAKPANVAAEHSYLFDNYIVDTPSKDVIVSGKPQAYLGHPDNVLLDNGDIITAYPVGHGKGETLLKRSTDTGLTWSSITGMPDSFKYTEETPTLYKLDFVGERIGDQKLLIASGRPGGGEVGEGFDISLSSSGTRDTNGKFHTDGAIWSPHKNYFGEHAEAGFEAEVGKYNAVVAFASLTQLKDSSGNLANKWMGLFHDYDHFVYETILTFNANDDMVWTVPARVLSDEYRDIELELKFCEPEVVRSPDGKELAMIFRTQSKTSNSHVVFSTDEGTTWSAPKALSIELTGERHKAEYDPLTGKLIISYRSITWKVGQEHDSNTWYSRGWLTWVGDYSDLHAGAEGKGDYVLKLAHTYAEGQNEVSEYADADTGYTGLTIDSSGLAVATSYGKFSPSNDPNLGGKTYIVTRRFRLNDINAHFDIPAFPII